jgi:hypothetical protein
MSQPGREQRDLPALRLDDRDLPVALAPERAREEPVSPIHEGWSTHASQLEVRGLAMSADGELWAATAGGVLRWRSHDRFVRSGSPFSRSKLRPWVRSVAGCTTHAR